MFANVMRNLTSSCFYIITERVHILLYPSSAACSATQTHTIWTLPHSPHQPADSGYTAFATVKEQRWACCQQLRVVSEIMCVYGIIESVAPVCGSCACLSSCSMLHSGKCKYVHNPTAENANVCWHTFTLVRSSGACMLGKVDIIMNICSYCWIWNIASHKTL